MGDDAFGNHMRSESIAAAARRATGHTCPRWAAHSLAAGAGAPRQAEPHLQVPNQIHVNINIDISI
jgi:hypothetical protein